MVERPPLDLSSQMIECLKSYSGTTQDQLTTWLEQRLWPTYVLETHRESGPQRPGVFGRLVGQKAASPVLSPMASKFGGFPYLESEGDWPTKGGKRLEYLGQVNFSDPPAHVPDVPREGIVVFFLDRDWPCDNPVNCRYYPKPASDRLGNALASFPSVARFETSIRFRPSWDLSDADAWEKLLPSKDERLWEEMLDWRDKRLRSLGKRDGQHEMWGHPSSALLEALGVDELTGHRVLLCSTFDNEAGFSWGSNCLYVVIADADLRSNQLERTKSYVANV